MSDMQKNPADKVKLPAVGILVVGILGLVSALYSTLDVLFSLNASLAESFGLPPEAQKALAMGGAYGLISVVINVVGSVFLIWAAMGMMKLRGHTAALVASVIAMIPCWGCCCLGLPVGIWALIVLLNPEVKAAFDAHD